MAETLRIEIPIETVDETSAGIESVISGLNKMNKAFKNANEETEKAKEYVSQFDKQSQKTEKSLARWAKEKYEILLEAKDRIAPVLSTLRNGIRSFVGRTWSVTMRAIDFVTTPVRGIINLLKNPAFQVGAVLGVSIGLKDTIDTYKDFEAAMSQVQAISGASGSELAKLTDKAKEMGATTKFTAQESAEAFNYMAMAGWKTEDMLGGIEGILSLAAASGEDLATTSDIITDALTAFGKQASDAGHFSDVMAAASSNANTNVSMMGETFKYAGAMAGTLKYSIEDVALATGLMANAGIKGNMAGTALNSIFTRLSTNTNGAADALNRLGIAYFNTDGSARAFSDIMKELRDATANFTDEQKANLGNTIAGTYAQKGFLAILNATTDDYNKLSDAINNAEGAAANMSDIMMDNLQGSITLLQSAVDGVKISFGERLSPYVRGLAEWLTNQMPEVEQGLNEFMDWLDTRVDRIQRKFDAIVDTKEWQEADFFGKVKIAWDEFIAEPFFEWWNSVGKAKFAGFAQDIGIGIGTGLKAGIMTLLGIDLGETFDEGSSIGASFAKGFFEGFDFDAVSGALWQGFKNMLSSAGKLLPGGASADLSSVLSVVMLGKIATPFINMGKGAGSIGKWLFGANAATGISRISALMGSTGNAMVSGSGILGTLANVGYGLTGGGSSAGMYFGSMAGTMSGSTAALVGAGSVAGGIAGAAGLIHGAMDLYTGFTSDDAEKAKAYKKAGAVEVGGTLAGAGAGAAAGAAIGAVFGGVGAVPGALIGAGVGAVGSWIAGNKIKDDYEKNAERMLKEAQTAQKAFEATGLSIDEIKFKNKELMEAMHDSEVSAQQFALMLQEECAKVAKNAFGDISLSLAEIKKASADIVFAGMEEQLDRFSQAASNAETALAELQASSEVLRKENWKVGLNMELSELDKDGYKSAIEDFVNASQTYIEDNHYEVTTALKLLVGDDADTSGLDDYYEVLTRKAEYLGSRLTDSMSIAMTDGIISLNEKSELESIQNQILEITDKLSSVNTDANMHALRVKYKGAALDTNSFNAMLEEMKTEAEYEQEQLFNALNLTSKHAYARLHDAEEDYNNGLITDKEYRQIYDDVQDQLDKADQSYYIQLEGVKTRISDFGLEGIADAFSSELVGILPEIEGTTKEKLEQAMDNALLIKPDVNTWTEADVKEWFGLDSLAALNGEAFETIYYDLMQTALAVPQGAKEKLLQDYKRMVPTAEEIKAAIDWDSMTLNDLNTLMESVTGPLEGPAFSAPSQDGKKLLSELYDEEYIERIKQSRSEALSKALEESANNEILDSFIAQYMADAGGRFDMENIMQRFGPISNGNYEQIVMEWQETGAECGDALNSGVSESILSGSQIFMENIQTALDNATASPFMISPVVNMIPKYGISGTAWEIGGHASGGYVSGGPQLSWLAEEGYGEFVIPTNPSRRSRALDLYEQAGIALGVSAHAAGGYVGGSILSDAAYSRTAERNYERDTQIYEPVASEKTSSVESGSIQVSVNVAPEFVIHGTEGQSEENIMQIIRRHMKEMADELGGEIAGKLEEVFSNMPLKEA